MCVWGGVWGGVCVCVVGALPKCKATQSITYNQTFASIKIECIKIIKTS